MAAWFSNSNSNRRTSEDVSVTSLYAGARCKQIYKNRTSDVIVSRNATFFFFWKSAVLQDLKITTILSWRRDDWSACVFWNTEGGKQKRKNNTKRVVLIIIIIIIHAEWQAFTTYRGRTNQYLFSNDSRV